MDRSTASYGGGHRSIGWFILGQYDDIVNSVQRTVFGGLAAFILPAIVAITIFALLGLTSTGWQILAYMIGLFCFIAVIARSDLRADD